MTHAQWGDDAGAGTDDVARQRITKSGSAARIDQLPVPVSAACNANDYLSNSAGSVLYGRT